MTRQAKTRCHLLICLDNVWQASTEKLDIFLIRFDLQHSTQPKNLRTLCTFQYILSAS